MVHQIETMQTLYSLCLDVYAKEDHDHAAVLKHTENRRMRL